MKKTMIAARAALAGIALAFTGSMASPALAAGGPAPQAMPAPRILVFDRNTLMRSSKAGQDIARQVRAYLQQAQQSLKGESDALQREGQTLRQQIAILAPDVKEQKIKAFEAKQAALQKKAQEREGQIRYGAALAEHQIEQTLGPIVQQIMQQRGANMMIDRQAVLVMAPGFDITPQVVQQLDQKLPAVKVQLVTPPAELLQRMQPAQQ